VRHGPGLAQHVNNVELVAIQVELDGAPGVRGDTPVQIVRQLVRAQGVDLPIEMFAHGTDGARVGVHRLGLKALEFEMFEMAGVALLERRRGMAQWHHGSVPSMGCAAQSGRQN